ncbi:hypothetical protein NXY28_26105 [Bacteroides thetaiotaomicron]|nr:hypothetical protein NXY28_26105 [Bacteroides thetaiotaomicron]
MKKYSRILIIANLILLLGYFNWSVYQKEQTLKEGQLVLLQLAPCRSPFADARRLYEA